MTIKDMIRKIRFKVKFKVIHVENNIIIVDRFAREKKYECENCGWQFDKRIDYEVHTDICVRNLKTFEEI